MKSSPAMCREFAVYT